MVGCGYERIPQICALPDEDVISDIPGPVDCDLYGSVGSNGDLHCRILLEKFLMWMDGFEINLPHIYSRLPAFISGLLFGWLLGRLWPLSIERGRNKSKRWANRQMRGERWVTRP